jgi:hypothetical protein
VRKGTAFTSLTHVLNQGVTYVLNRALFDGTLRPQSRAALSGLPTVVFRAASQRLGSHLTALCARKAVPPFQGYLR